jgi:hypothetical protein
MKFTIKKGTHRAVPFMLNIWFNKTILRRSVLFDYSCRYDLGSADQFDHNKLFGIGFLWDKKDSARFGWRFDLQTSKIIISAYCHINGVVVMKDICSVFTLNTYIFILEKVPGVNAYQFTVTTNSGNVLGSTTVPFFHKKKICFPMNFYFGGNRTAPHEIICSLKKV